MPNKTINNSGVTATAGNNGDGHPLFHKGTNTNTNTDTHGQYFSGHPEKNRTRVQDECWSRNDSNRRWRLLVEYKLIPSLHFHECIRVKRIRGPTDHVIIASGY